MTTAPSLGSLVRAATTRRQDWPTEDALVSEASLASALALVTKTFLDTEALALAQFEHQVAWAKVSQADCLWAPDAAAKGTDPHYLLDLRLFSAKGELHLWRDDSGSLVGRLRLDNVSDGAAVSDVLDEDHFLWGKDLDRRDDGWLHTREGHRGIALCLPWTAAADDAARALPLKLAVRSYLQADAATGMLGIVDTRLVGLFARNDRTWLGAPQDAATAGGAA